MRPGPRILEKWPEKPRAWPRHAPGRRRNRQEYGCRCLWLRTLQIKRPRWLVSNDGRTITRTPRSFSQWMMCWWTRCAADRQRGHAFALICDTCPRSYVRYRKHLTRITIPQVSGIRENGRTENSKLDESLNLRSENRNLKLDRPICDFCFRI